jgi:nitroreductase
MDVAAAIYGRRAVRAFTSEPVRATAIQQLIDAAVQAPSSMDSEPWAFIVVEGAGTLQQLSNRAKEHFIPNAPPAFITPRIRSTLADPTFNIFHDAPTLIVVCATTADPQAAEDCSLAAQNLMLAAHAAGLATCPIGFSRPWLRLPETKEELKIDPRYVPAFPVVVGHPAEHPSSPGRRQPIIIKSYG